MWLSLLARFWKPLAGAALLIGASLYLHHAGYESGYAASEAQWQPRFAEAARARDAANTVARRKEADSTALSVQSEKQHDETIASLNLRAADAEHRYASLLRQHSAGPRSGAVPQDCSAAGDADATRASSELIDRTSKDFGSLARRCESDAATLTDLQEWVRGQRAILGN